MAVSKAACWTSLLFLTVLVVFLINCPTINGGQNTKTKHSNFESGKRPHIIFIVADDLGYNDVSFHGSDQIPTPNIDFLGYNGVILNKYYVSPLCSPTRSSLMTGRHPIHTGLQHSVISRDQPYGLPLNETLMPEYLNQLGYRSHIVGKWHLGFFQWQYTPLYRGFESHNGYYQGRSDYYTHTYEADLAYSKFCLELHGPNTLREIEEWGLDFRRDKKLVRNETGSYSTTLFRDEAVRIIQEHDKAQPLFLYLPFQAVHSGNADGPHLQAPQSYIDKFSYIENMDRRIYAAMLSSLDDAVGDVYDTLKHRGMLANSIIIFTTDNGGAANGFDNNAASNFPLRGVKNTLWEGGVRGVGLVHSPLLRRQGYTSDKMLHVCDWLPTLLTAAGGEHLLDNMSSLDGVDAWQMLSSDGKAVRSELLHNIDPVKNIAALRVGDYKLLTGNISKKWGGWYPPYQLAGDEVTLNYRKFEEELRDVEEAEKTRDRRLSLHGKYRTMWPPSVNQRMIQLYSFAGKSRLYTGPYAGLTFARFNTTRSSLDGSKKFAEFSSLGKTTLPVGGSPVKIVCGPKPANASTNCQAKTSPCLYHIPSDPCEYNNIAAGNKDIVKKMLARLSQYSASMVPPANKPSDPLGNPRLHDGAWVPWR